MLKIDKSFSHWSLLFVGLSVSVGVDCVAGDCGGGGGCDDDAAAAAAVAAACAGVAFSLCGLLRSTSGMGGLRK